ncbi:hypothetical protein ACFQ9X_52395 [Catenulispora yoronensis]
MRLVPDDPQRRACLAAAVFTARTHLRAAVHEENIVHVFAHESAVRAAMGEAEKFAPDGGGLLAPKKEIHGASQVANLYGQTLIYTIKHAGIDHPLLPPDRWAELDEATRDSLAMNPAESDDPRDTVDSAVALYKRHLEVLGALSPDDVRAAMALARVGIAPLFTRPTLAAVIAMSAHFARAIECWLRVIVLDVRDLDLSGMSIPDAGAAAGAVWNLNTIWPSAVADTVRAQSKPVWRRRFQVEGQLRRRDWKLFENLPG